MAKIKHYKVPVLVKRDAKGHVELEIKEDQQTLDREEPVNVDNGGEVLRLSKELADHNAQEYRIAKSTLLASEQENNTFIIIKKLEE